MVKRPQGLNKSSKAKRSKIDLPNSAAPDAEENGTPKVQLELDVDPDDELGQLKALYDTYLASITEGDEEEDARGQKILFGVVHESDRMLRNQQEDQPLPAEFHNIYALALLGLAKYAEPLKDEEEDDKAEEEVEKAEDASKEFIEAAIERTALGLSAHPESASLLFTKAKALIALAQEEMKIAALTDSPLYETACAQIKTVEDAIEHYKKAESIVIDETQEAATKRALYTQDQLDTIESLLRLGEGFGELENLRIAGDLDEEVNKPALSGLPLKYAEWSKQRWEQILENIPVGKGKAKSPEDDGDHSYAIMRRANRGLGEYHLALAQPLILELENEVKPSEDDVEKVKERLSTAIEYLVKAEHENDSKGTIYPIIAEAQIELANLLDNESAEQEALYKEAALRLRKATRLGLDDFQDQIDELEGN